MGSLKYVFKIATFSHPVKKSVIVWESISRDTSHIQSRRFENMAMLASSDCFAMVDTNKNTYNVLKNRNGLEIFTVYFNYHGDIIERRVSYDCLYALCHFVADNDMSFIIRDENQLTEALLF